MYSDPVKAPNLGIVSSGGMSSTVQVFSVASYLYVFLYV